MIKVNLLPVKQAKKARKAIMPSKIELPVGWLVIGVAFLIINIAGAYLYHRTLQAKADGIQQEILEVEQAIARLKIDIRNVSEAKKKKEQLQQKINIIDTLKKGQTGPVRLLDQLSQSLPPKLWLLDMSENGTKIQMNGVAFGDEEIALFMKNLEKSPYFHSVELSHVTTERRSGFKADLKGFQLSCNIRYTGITR